MDTKQYKLARTIAEMAHRGVKRKPLGTDAGLPYIVHPSRVAGRIEAGPDFTIELAAAAWLHDVIEDTDVTADDLRTLGVHEQVIQLVLAVTKGEHETHAEYIGRVIQHGDQAIALKVADIQDNVATLPEGHSLRKRYTKALDRLRG